MLLKAFSSLVVIVSLGFLISACSSRPQRPVSAHYDGKKFRNPHSEGSEGFFDFLRVMVAMVKDKESWPTDLKNSHQPKLPEKLSAHQVAVTFVNHATVLIQFEGLNVLTDPVWSKRASPLTWIGPTRYRPPGLEFEKLPKIGLVVISHNHYDHLDLATLKKISDQHQPVILVPLGDKKLLESQGIKNVTEMDWWDQVPIQEQFQVTFTPTQHFSSRGLFDRDHSLWGSYMIEHKGRRIYFGGDAGYSPHYKEIHEKLGRPDLSFIPIGAYEPNWFMKRVHMNPREAVQAHLDLESKKSIGIHFGTFQLTTEAIDQPLKDLSQALSEKRIAPEQFSTLHEGQTKVFDLSSASPSAKSP